MQKVFWIFTGILALALAACGQSASPTALPTVSLDSSNISSTTPASSGNSVSASALVVPLHEAQLSFTTIGRVTSVNVKVGDVVKAGDVLVQLETAIQEAKVSEAEANLLAAEIQVRYLKRVGVGDQVHLDAAEADVARAQALLDSAKATLLSQAALTSPFEGTIVSVDIDPAETVTPGKIVIVIGDLSGYRIETTDLSERDVPNVKIGQSARVFIDALNQEFDGKVTDIDRISTTLGGDVVYKVTIELDEQPQDLFWGMSADVEINVEN